MKIRKIPFDYDRFNREIAIHMPCQHLKIVTGHKLMSNGHSYFRMQCSDCGAPISKRMDKKSVAELSQLGQKMADWDEVKFLEYTNKRGDLSSKIYQQINIERHQAWWSDYNTYLKSSEWKLQSRSIMKRANYLCELCKINKAIQVHHLTYERVGEESQEDLQALCYDCHDRAHNGMFTLDKMFAELDKEFGISESALFEEN